MTWFDAFSDPYLQRVQHVTLTHAPDAALIGGAVRDLLLGRPVQDMDYVTRRDGLEVARRVADTLAAAFYPLDEERRIGRVVWQQPERTLVVDIASLPGVTLLEDIQRRDFTINAMAILPYGDLYDPLGGQADLEARVLRPCSPDSLRNDPVRTLRAVRFLLSLNLKPAPGLDHLIWHAAPFLSRVSPERRRDEFLKLLALPRPHWAVERMTDWRISDVMMPELVALQGVAQPPPHRFDVYQHALETLRWASCLDQWLRGTRTPQSEWEIVIYQRLEPYAEALNAYLQTRLSGDRARWLWFRFAALAHDWGKAAAFREDETGRATFLRHEKESAHLAEDWLKRYHCARQEIAFVQKLCAGHMRPMSLFIAGESPTQRALFRFYRDMEDAAPAGALLFLADFLGARGEPTDEEELKAALDATQAWLEPLLRQDPIIPAPLLNGTEVMQVLGLQPGPRIGQLLEALQEAQVMDQVRTREEALDFLRQLVVQTSSAGR